MKHCKKILAILMALTLCGSLAACSSSAANTADDSEPAETADENTEEEEKAEAEAETEENDTDKTVNIGIFASSLDRGVTTEFVTAVQTALSEQYAGQINEVLVMNAQGNKALLFEMLHNFWAGWGGNKNIILLVNDEEMGFSDEDLSNFLEDAKEIDFIVGIDHAIDGAAENSFVYDASDPAGCASLIMENVLN